MQETAGSEYFLNMQRVVVGVVDFDWGAICDIGRDFGSYKGVHLVGILYTLSIDLVHHLTHVCLDDQVVLNYTHRTRQKHY